MLYSAPPKVIDPVLALPKATIAAPATESVPISPLKVIFPLLPVAPIVIFPTSLLAVPPIFPLITTAPAP